ncbi:hypothetical protein F5051DRAFT_434199 [Lentinula edodes]|nr:hypothetical protein F5051DRAFT_434199 [Lentinula edodes]
MRLSSPGATFATLSSPIHLRSRESVAPASKGEVEQDELAFTIESPSQPQLQLFKNVFNTGKSLASYCRDDPFWSTLAEVALPCSNCVRHPELFRTSHIAKGFWNYTGPLLNTCPGAFLKMLGAATTAACILKSLPRARFWN